MSIEVGAKLSGKVSGITDFGAFVDLGDKKTGLVHISEVSNTFVKDIHEVLSVGDEVTVKVLSVSDDGKIGLSIKKAVDKPQKQNNQRRNNNHSLQKNKKARSNYLLPFVVLAATTATTATFSFCITFQGSQSIFTFLQKSS